MIELLADRKIGEHRVVALALSVGDGEVSLSLPHATACVFLASKSRAVFSVTMRQGHDTAQPVELAPRGRLLFTPDSHGDQTLVIGSARGERGQLAVATVMQERATHLPQHGRRELQQNRRAIGDDSFRG